MKLTMETAGLRKIDVETIGSDEDWVYITIHDLDDVEMHARLLRKSIRGNEVKQLIWMLEMFA